ncbi:histone-lysine N-methyltransferase SMYD3-like [Paramacrobiotus metropolitanus]|uniref:histone-lysine N-methyltransferase SMYD3-like n=1 Tax=Paramacrobiotus metropolitanus TaxID=2943436 RepID=UPI0024457FF9|nr:histone-lysine N-methyltransferase SMYD3-like [Paramacrobiotus metropolitanus]
MSAGPYSTGALILRNHPLAYVVENNRRAEVCEYCFRSDLKVLRCSKCKLSSYCSPDCQKKSWKESHKHECDGLKRTEGKLSSFMQLLAQTVLKLKLGIDGEDPKRNITPFQRRFHDLASHWTEAKCDKEIADYITQAGKTLADYFADPAFEEFLRFDSLGEIYSRIKSNAYAIQGPMNEPVGHGVFLSAAKFDHSCKPNSSQSYDGPDMIVRAITEIPAVEDVRVTYTALHQPARLRRKFLKEHYFFDCECERCNDVLHDAMLQSIMCQKKTCGEAVPYRSQPSGAVKCPHCKSKVAAKPLADADQLMTDGELVISRMEAQMSRGEFASVVQLADPILRRAAGLLHPKHFVICTMSLLCSSAYTSLGDFNMAFTFSQNALEGTTFAYPEKHIAVGSHLLQLIRVGLQTNIRAKSLYDDLELLGRNALSITRIAAGGDSAVHKKAIELYEAVMAEGRAMQHLGGGCDGCGNHHHH